MPQAYCETCHTFLADRFVVGKCPTCGEKTRGDQCDACGTVLDPEDLVEPHCTVCNSIPVFKETKHLYIATTKLKKLLQKLVDEHPNWRKNAIALTNRYIDEGLCDRALTRDLDWGIEVPKEGYEGKKIYIWAENVLGYLSMSLIVAKQRNVDFKELWGDEARHYYVHAKDNIPFHTIILPALLLAEGDNYHLPDEIISNEYQTLEGRKISTSQNWAIWIKDIVDTYHPDALRYFFIANGPEKRDTDFSWNEFINSNNGELVGAYGNFINRTLVFIHKYFDGKIPEGKLTAEWEQKLKKLYDTVGSCIDHGNLKEGLETIFEEVRNANKYYDQQAPWTTRTTNLKQCEDTIYNCTQLVLNFAKLLQPYLPFSSKEVLTWFGNSEEWEFEVIEEGYQIPETKILFERIPKERIEEEKRKMTSNRKES